MLQKNFLDGCNSNTVTRVFFSLVRVTLFFNNTKKSSKISKLDYKKLWRKNSPTYIKTSITQKLAHSLSFFTAISSYSLIWNVHLSFFCPDASNFALMHLFIEKNANFYLLSLLIHLVFDHHQQTHKHSERRQRQRHSGWMNGGY